MSPVLALMVRTVHQCFSNTGVTRNKFRCPWHGCDQKRVRIKYVTRCEHPTRCVSRLEVSLLLNATTGLAGRFLSSSRQVTSSISCAEFCPRGAVHLFFATAVSGPSHQFVTASLGFCVFSVRLTEGFQVDGYSTKHDPTSPQSFFWSALRFRQDEFSVFHHIFGVLSLSPFHVGPLVYFSCILQHGRTSAFGARLMDLRVESTVRADGFSFGVQASKWSSCLSDSRVCPESFIPQFQHGRGEHSRCVFPKRVGRGLSLAPASSSPRDSCVSRVTSFVDRDGLQGHRGTWRVVLKQGFGMQISGKLHERGGPCKLPRTHSFYAPAIHGSSALGLYSHTPRSFVVR